jgi:hypothetical protein
MGNYVPSCLCRQPHTAYSYGCPFALSLEELGLDLCLTGPISTLSLFLVYDGHCPGGDI